MLSKEAVYTLVISESIHIQVVPTFGTASARLGEMIGFSSMRQLNYLLHVSQKPNA